MKHRYFVMLWICLPWYNNALAVQKAVINVPIADLIGQQIHTIRSHEQIDAAYNSLAVCGGNTNSAYSCPRLHQLLYNDIVEIIKETAEEVCIRTTHAYYLIPSISIPQNQYWTLKKNVTMLDDLTKNNIALNHIPVPIDFSDKCASLTCPDIVTLTEPHYDPQLRITFSAGTRFVCTSQQLKKKNTILIFAIDYRKLQEHIIKIPRNKCIFYDPNKTKEERIADYVTLLKKWAHIKRGCIPYVWGGTSFVSTVSGAFKEVTQTTENGDYSFYQYEKDNNIPKSGFDCSGVVARATQICGIPYFCKNTTTIAQCLTPLATDQQIIPGDLILIRGHVMVVSDVNKNLLIEARAYSHGYGKLHEIPISQVFEGIHTYKDLLDAYTHKKVVKRKDKNGNVRDSFANVQLFSIMSV